MNEKLKRVENAFITGFKAIVRSWKISFIIVSPGVKI
jgi:hypothetical protein